MLTLYTTSDTITMSGKYWRLTVHAASDVIVMLFSQNSEMCQHLADNVHRTMQHAVEVEEKIPLDQVGLSVCQSVGLSVCL